MAEIKKRRCMVCAKEFEMGTSICDACNARIRGEAAGKQEGARKDAEREIKRAGIASESRKPERGK